MDDLLEMAERLEAIAEELGDLSLDLLRRAVEGEEGAEAAERRVTRARRAVLRAAGILAFSGDDGDDGEMEAGA